MNKTYASNSKFPLRLTIKIHLLYANIRGEARNKYRDCDTMLAGHAYRTPHGRYRMRTGN
jgi:hypothetical protein